MAIKSYDKIEKNLINKTNDTTSLDTLRSKIRKLYSNRTMPIAGTTPTGTSVNNALSSSTIINSTELNNNYMPITYDNFGKLITACLVINDIPNLRRFTNDDQNNLQNIGQYDKIFQDGTTTNLVSNWLTSAKVNATGTSADHGCRGACMGICTDNCSSTCSNECTGNSTKTNGNTDAKDPGQGTVRIYGTADNYCGGGCAGGCLSGCGGCTGCMYGCEGSLIGDTSVCDCTGCTASCGLTCEGTCNNGCGGCDNDCGSSCKTSCAGGCNSGCSGQCGSGCKGKCYTTCTGNCYTTCSSNNCKGKCDSQCSNVCVITCSHSCQNSCTRNCQNNCYGTAKDGCYGVNATIHS